jgi:hypothetical protein
MGFEFEALYWAKLAEEEAIRHEAEKQRKLAEGWRSATAETTANPRKQPTYDEDTLPV